MKKRIMGAILILAIVLAAVPVFTPVALADADFLATVSVSNHTMVIKADGSLWTWGGNRWGQLGDGTTTDRSSPVKIMDGVSSVSAGFSHSLAVKTDGSLWAWGGNLLGQVGDGTATDRHSPVKIMDGVSAVSAGNATTLAIKTDGSLWAWGWNSSGQIGDGTKTDRHSPVKIMDGVSSASVGVEYCLAVKTDGSLWAWGDNWYGRLGDGTTNSTNSPVKIMDGVSSAAAGFYHSMAVKTDGSLWAWGKNNIGQLGDGSTTHSKSPVFVMDDVSSVSVGKNDYYLTHTPISFAIKNDGSLWGWGYGSELYLDNLPETDSLKHVKILDSVASVSVGENATMILRTDGSLWAWGDGYARSPFKTMDGVLLPGQTPTAPPPPTEPPSPWAVADVTRAVSLALVPTALQSQYTQPATRAEFCALAVALYEKQKGSITGRGKFDDTVDVNVEKAAYIGVVNGTSPDKFTPNATLTREQAATMLARLAGALDKPLPKQPPSFDDNGNISSWALEAVGQVQAAGIMTGTSPGKFSPQGPYTREQSIVTILRLYDAVK